MKLLDYAWNTATSISGRDHQNLRLLLDEDLVNPILSSDSRGYVIKLPVPRRVKEGFYTLHGLYFDEDRTSWLSSWRLFKASLYHTSLHAAYSNFQSYPDWAKGKDLTAATYSVSLIEDLKVTMGAARDWKGLLGDIAYANYISSLRVHDPDDIDSRALRFATKLLFKVWGVNHSTSDPSDEDIIVSNLSNEITQLVRQSVNTKQDDNSLLLQAVDTVYKAIMNQGTLREVISLPYAEAHGKCSIFDNKMVDRENSKELMQAAYQTLGLGTSLLTEQDTMAFGETEEFRHLTKATETSMKRIMEKYNELIAPTRLDSVEIPKGDYGMFLRARAVVSGAVRSIRDRLKLVRNASDENSGYESGQVDITAAIQVMASGTERNDVFTRDDIINKEEAWAILVDTSKSISTVAHEIRSITACLAEIAKDLMPAQNRWGLFGFNNSLQVIKEFKESYDIESKARIGGITQRNSTLLPDAMLACYKALAEIPVDNKILMVVSDGYPTGYSQIERNLVSTINQISKTGCLLMGVGVDNPAIQDYFTVSCVLESPYQMMKFFAKSYLELASMF
ncbi:MAG: hypothetical protein HYY67_03730 [Thaumarchaeota archaeon]|nr:hypothetical protein [Nitrososphaerota archaeon]